MKLEIKTKCAICDEVVEHLTERNVNETILLVQLCPTCHPPKPDKVTPKDGEGVEVRGPGYFKECYFRTIATGKRGDNGRCIGAIHSTESGGLFWLQWRYPGETEWRD